MLNFLYPRQSPSLPQQGLQLMEAVTKEPNNIRLQLSTDLGCQVQWFTHSLYEGEDSNTALFVLLQTVLANMNDILAGSMERESALSTLYEQAMFAQTSSEGACTRTKGCQWDSGNCIKNDEQTALSYRFGDLMCFGDGTGDELRGAALTKRITDLAHYFGQAHIKPYLSFYFDTGFSEQNPHLKFTRGYLQFGGPIEGFVDPQQHRPVQERALVDWFQVIHCDLTDEIIVFYCDSFLCYRYYCDLW